MFRGIFGFLSVVIVLFIVVVFVLVGMFYYL